MSWLEPSRAGEDSTYHTCDALHQSQGDSRPARHARAATKPRYAPRRGLARGMRLNRTAGRRSASKSRWHPRPPTRRESWPYCLPCSARRGTNRWGEHDRRRPTQEAEGSVGADWRLASNGTTSTVLLNVNKTIEHRATWQTKEKPRSLQLAPAHSSTGGWSSSPLPILISSQGPRGDPRPNLRFS